MATKYKNILKVGKILENWLEDFPQHITVNPQSYYQLIIDNSDLTLEFTLPSNIDDLTIDLPFLQNYNYNCIIQWGDGESSRVTSAIDKNKTHTYLVPGVYQVRIIGNCQTFNNYEYELANGKNAWEYLTAIITWRGY